MARARVRVRPRIEVAAALVRAQGRLPSSRGIGAEAAARAVGYED